ncbi:MAG: hypothetical protein V3V11_06740 [Vicinamibacteria bacterium]
MARSRRSARAQSQEKTLSRQSTKHTESKEAGDRALLARGQAQCQALD